MIAPGPFARLRDDNGVTLVELVIYSLLLVIIGGFVGNLIVRGFVAQRDIGAASAATSTGQTAAQSIVQGVRNASVIGLVPSASGTQLLVARVAGDEAVLSWTCQAWYFDGDEIYTVSSSTGAPTEVQAAGGVLLAAGVTELSASTPVFDAPSTFSTATRSVSIRFETDNGEGRSVLFDTIAVSRQPTPSAGPGGQGVAPCF